MKNILPKGRPKVPWSWLLKFSGGIINWPRSLDLRIFEQCAPATANIWSIFPLLGDNSAVLGNFYRPDASSEAHHLSCRSSYSSYHLHLVKCFYCIVLRLFHIEQLYSFMKKIRRNIFYLANTTRSWVV